MHTSSPASRPVCSCNRPLDLQLDIRDELTGIGLVPAPVELLSSQAELDDQVAGEVLRLNLVAIVNRQITGLGLLPNMVV
jgi:hypothetical protein